MANIVAVVVDLFDIISGSSMKKVEIIDTMKEILLSLEENDVLDGFDSELDECFGMNAVLDDAINAYYAAVESDDLGYDVDDD